MILSLPSAFRRLPPSDSSLYALRDYDRVLLRTDANLHSQEPGAGGHPPAHRRPRRGPARSRSEGQSRPSPSPSPIPSMTVKVTYVGLLPDLFREGQGAVVEGTVGTDGIFSRRQRSRQTRRALYAERGRGRLEEARASGSEGDAMPCHRSGHDEARNAGTRQACERVAMTPSIRTKQENVIFEQRGVRFFFPWWGGEARRGRDVSFRKKNP